MTASSGHYQNRHGGVNVNSNANWTKVFGPWALYFNNGDSGDACWQDAKNQALAEQQAWPYTWLTASAVYQPRSQRATVTGKLIIHDALRPGASAAGAWVGLAAPDSGKENAPDNWQFQADGYQYWCRRRRTAPLPSQSADVFHYGGPATFQLYAFSAAPTARPAVWASFHRPFTFDSGPPISAR